MREYVNGFSLKINGVYYTENGERFVVPKGISRNRRNRSWVVRIMTEPRHYAMRQFQDKDYGNDYTESYLAAFDALKELQRAKDLNHAILYKCCWPKRTTPCINDETLRQKYLELVERARKMGVRVMIDATTNEVMAKFYNRGLSKYPDEDRIFNLGSLEQVCRDDFEFDEVILHYACIFFQKHSDQLSKYNFSQKIGPYYFYGPGATIWVPEGVYRDRSTARWRYQAKGSNVVYFYDKGSWVESLREAISYARRQAR
jgi:hypothetical protein